MSSTSTFLRDSGWRSIPWEDNPASKTPIDHLIDIGTDICQYNHILEGLDGRFHSNEAEYHNLATQVSTSFGELNTWWRKWEINHANAATETTAPSKSSAFSTILEYKTLWDAFTICIYDVVRILLLQLWGALRPFSNFYPLVLNEPNNTVLLGISSSLEGLACEILRSLGYSYRMSRRFVYTSSFLVISDVAYGCFDRESKEARWLVEHGWAELEGQDDVEDVNILNVMLPLGQIKIGKLYS